MRPLRVEPVDVSPDVGPGGTDVVIGLEIHAFVFDAAPQPFDEHVVAPGATPIHGQPAATLEYGLGEVLSRELAALVSVDDFRRAVTGEGLFQNFRGVARFQGIYAGNR